MKDVLNLKLIGFIKEHNDIMGSKEYAKYIGDCESVPDSETLLKIVDYLDNGILLLAWMGYFKDLDSNQLICPDSYFTDGVYTWPAYFPYYVKKHTNFSVDKEFVLHITKNNFEFDKDSIKSETISFLEDCLLAKLNSKYIKGKSPR